MAVGQEQRIRTLKYDGKTWTESPPAPVGTAEGDLHAIEVQIKNGDHRRALSAIKKYMKKYGGDHEFHPNMLIAKAKALIGRRDYQKAHVVLQEFLGAYSGMSLTQEALRLEFVIAENFLAGVKRKIWGVRLLSGKDLGFTILDEISTDHPEAGLAELAIKTKADRMFDAGDHALAEMEYGRLIREYPRSRYHQFALRRSADAALASFGGIEYDEAALIEAEERFDDYSRQYPAQAKSERIPLILEDIRAKRAEKEFAVARYYERTEHLSSAVMYYRSVVRNWPETIAAAKASARLDMLGAPANEPNAASPDRSSVKGNGR